MTAHSLPLHHFTGRRDGSADHVRAIVESINTPLPSDLADGFWTVRFPAGEWLVCNELEREVRYERMASLGECTLHAATVAELEEAGARLVASINRDLNRWNTTE